MALAGQPGDVLHPIRVLSEEVMPISPYEIMAIALMVLGVLIEIVKLNHRK